MSVDPSTFPFGSAQAPVSVVAEEVFGSSYNQSELQLHGLSKALNTWTADNVYRTVFGFAAGLPESDLPLDELVKKDEEDGFINIGSRWCADCALIEPLTEKQKKGIVLGLYEFATTFQDYSRLRFGSVPLLLMGGSPSFFKDEDEHAGTLTDQIRLRNTIPDESVAEITLQQLIKNRSPWQAAVDGSHNVVLEEMLRVFSEALATHAYRGNTTNTRVESLNSDGFAMKVLERMSGKDALSRQAYEKEMRDLAQALFSPFSVNGDVYRIASELLDIDAIYKADSWDRRGLIYSMMEKVAPARLQLDNGEIVSWPVTNTTRRQDIESAELKKSRLTAGVSAAAGLVIAAGASGAALAGMRSKKKSLEANPPAESADQAHSSGGPRTAAAAPALNQPATRHAAQAHGETAPSEQATQARTSDAPEARSAEAPQPSPPRKDTGSALRETGTIESVAAPRQSTAVPNESFTGWDDLLKSPRGGQVSARSRPSTAQLVFGREPNATDRFAMKNTKALKAAKWTAAATVGTLMPAAGACAGLLSHPRTGSHLNDGTRAGLGMVEGVGAAAVPVAALIGHHAARLERSVDALNATERSDSKLIAGTLERLFSAVPSSNHKGLTDYLKVKLGTYARHLAWLGTPDPENKYDHRRQGAAKALALDNQLWKLLTANSETVFASTVRQQLKSLPVNGKLLDVQELIDDLGLGDGPTAEPVFRNDDYRDAYEALRRISKRLSEFDADDKAAWWPKLLPLSVEANLSLLVNVLRNALESTPTQHVHRSDLQATVEALSALLLGHEVPEPGAARDLGTSSSRT